MKRHELMHSHFTMTFPSFHFTTLTYPSHPHHNLLPFTSPHFTLLHFLIISPTPSLRLIYYFANPFPKITWFTGESLKHLQVAGSRTAWSYLQCNIFRYLCFALLRHKVMCHIQSPK
jgi:hypothetical protein